MLAAVGGLLAGGAGCASVRPVGAGVATTHLIAVRYDVEPAFASQGHRAALEAIRRDFRRVRELGFDSVVLRHVDDRDSETLLDIAGATGLKAAVPRRNMTHFVTTGILPEGIRDSGELLGRVPREVIAHEALAALVVDPGPSQDTARRARELLTSLNRRGAVCVSSRGDGSDGLAVVDVGMESANPDVSPTERWLAQYHGALAAGSTGGVVVECYRRPPGDPPDLAADRVPLTAARAAALRELITRARRWSRSLRRSTAQPLAVILSSGLEVRVTEFLRARQRCVLVFNPSADRFARGEVLLPELVGGAAVSRAVEVLPSASGPAGRVIDARKGRIVLPIALRPGDARLFELF